jgi:hypothetical protein
MSGILLPGNLVVSRSVYRGAAGLHQQLRHRQQQRRLPGRVEQRFRGRQLRHHLAGTAPAAAESFRTVRTAPDRQVLRGVSFTPGT